VPEHEASPWLVTAVAVGSAVGTFLVSRRMAFRAACLGHDVADATCDADVSLQVGRASADAGRWPEDQAGRIAAIGEHPRRLQRRGAHGVPTFAVTLHAGLLGVL
jgi:hypothetical protein